MRRKAGSLVRGAALVAGWLLGGTWASGRAEEAPGPLKPPRAVKIEGVEGALNYSRSMLSWAASAEKGRPAAVLARDGDLLWLDKKEPEKEKAEEKDKGSGEAAIVFPYAEADGGTLAVKWEGFRASLAGKTVFLQLSKENDAWEWLDKAPREELESLRFVVIAAPINAERLAALKTLAQANPQVGLGGEGAKEEPQASSLVVPLFEPRCLFADDLKPLAEHVRRLEGLRFLDCRVGGGEGVEVLSRLTDLRALLLHGWDPGQAGPLPAPCKNLQMVTLIGAEIKTKDLLPVTSLMGLRELNLTKVKSLEDISALAKLPGLRTLTLSGCENVSDLSVLDKLPDLTWLGLPPKATQDDLAAIVRGHPKLQVLELVGCKEITDLGPLRDLRELESLVLVDSPAGTAPLHEMKGLRFLVLPKEVFAKSPDEVAKLEKDLPQCLIVEGAPMCMGSGWILLLVPALAGAGWLSARRRDPEK